MSALPAIICVLLVWQPGQRFWEPVKWFADKPTCEAYIRRGQANAYSGETACRYVQRGVLWP